VFGLLAGGTRSPKKKTGHPIFFASGGQGGSFRENCPPGPPAKAFDKILLKPPNEKFFGGPGGDFSKKPPGRRRQKMKKLIIDSVGFLLYNLNHESD
jgi:hypothetical protein